MTTLGEKVAILARLKSKRQQELADNSGKSRVSINRYFNGRTDMSSRDFAKILKSLDINIEEQIDLAIKRELGGKNV